MTTESAQSVDSAGSEVKRPCVLVFAGADPSGGAGIQADIEAIASLGAHPMCVITALTVQDNDHVYSVHPVPALLIQQQAQALINKIEISAVKIGIVGSQENAEAIAELIFALKMNQPDLPVVLDPVLASGNGEALAADDALQAIAALYGVTTLITPNLLEAAVLCGGDRRLEMQVESLLLVCQHALIKGGHASGDAVVNRWFTEGTSRTWSWPRLPGQFHGSGCTLASAIAALLANGQPMADAIDLGQAYCQQTLDTSYAIALGQRIPNRALSLLDEAS
ncbi:hydroxymethylpyrimidine/phosphomethylpyrimidine kinase [soil metagenome]